MTLSLDHRQRLNLIFVLGTYDVKGRELHAVWHLQDSLDLDQAEKQMIGFREQTLANGQTIQLWDDTKTVPVRSFDFTEADLNRVRQAMDEFPQMRASRDRVWAEPIYAQLPDSAQANGAAPQRP